MHKILCVVDLYLLWNNILLVLKIVKKMNGVEINLPHIWNYLNIDIKITILEAEKSSDCCLDYHLKIWIRHPREVNEI